MFNRDKIGLSCLSVVAFFAYFVAFVKSYCNRFLKPVRSYCTVDGLDF